VSAVKAFAGVEDLLAVLPSLAQERLENVDFGTYTQESDRYWVNAKRSSKNWSLGNSRARQSGHCQMDRPADENRSLRTIRGYSDIMKRMSDEVKNRPLRELGADPTIMEREIGRIRELLKHKKRGGQAMATGLSRGS
jgi:hypothetical protein